MNKSIELNWIRRRVDKSIPIPEVVFFPLEDAAGRYYPSVLGNEIYDIDGHPHSLKYGVIVISTFWEDEIESTIAHEWRHHWQWFHGIEFEINKFKDETLGYDKALKEYFITSKTELDALRFEHKYAGVSEYHKELLKDLLVGIKPKKLISIVHKKPLKKDYSKYTKYFKHDNKTFRNE